MSQPDASPTPAKSLPPREERLRFAEFTVDRLPNGRCKVRVLLTWQDDQRYLGESEGLTSHCLLYTSDAADD